MHRSVGCVLTCSCYSFAKYKFFKCSKKLSPNPNHCIFNIQFSQYNRRENIRWSTMIILMIQKPMTVCAFLRPFSKGKWKEGAHERLQFKIIHQKETKQFDNSFERYSWRKPHFSTEASSVAMVSIYCLPFLLQVVVNITQFKQILTWREKQQI